MSDDGNNMILVFQMAKVASRSWVKALRDQCSDKQVFHFHSVSSKSLTLFDEIMRAKGDRQTIKYLKTIPARFIGTPSGEIAPLFDCGTWRGEKTNLIAGVRDPVARAVSAVGFGTNYLGYTRQNVTVRDTTDVANLTDLFFKVLRVAQDLEDADEDSLVRYLAYLLSDYRYWFQDELRGAFGIDVSGTEFDFDKSALVDVGQHRALIYRVEDLGHPERGKSLITTTNRLFGCNLDHIPPDNKKGEQRFYAFYKRFVDSVRLSGVDLDWFYDHPVVEKFYTEDEVAMFRKRWAVS